MVLTATFCTFLRFWLFFEPTFSGVLGPALVVRAEIKIKTNKSPLGKWSKSQKPEKTGKILLNNTCFSRVDLHFKTWILEFCGGLTILWGFENWLLLDASIWRIFKRFLSFHKLMQKLGSLFSWKNKNISQNIKKHNKNISMEISTF